MAAITPPYAIQASSHPADVFRRAVSFAGLGQQGVRSWVSGDMAVSANGTPNMSVNVAAGQAAVNGTQNTTTQGAYFALTNDATVNLTIAASDPTNPRIDIVVAQVRDAAYSGGNNDWVLAVVTGTPAASPSAPATPANAIVLAQVAAAANATSIVSGNITDKRPIFGTLFQVKAYLASSQSLTASVTARVQYDTIEYDPNGNYATGATAQYTCPVAGRYFASVGSSIASVGDGTIFTLDLYKGGSLYKRLANLTPGASGSHAVSSAVEVRAAASDTLYAVVTETSGSTSLNTGSASTWFQASWQGAG